MPTPALPDAERLRRKTVIETLVNEGLSPPGLRDGRPSAAQEAKRRDGVNYPRWIHDEKRHRAKGLPSFLPNFIGADEDLEVVTLTAKGDEAATAHDHASVRAKALAAEVNSLVTGSKYPLINPDAIVVDSFVSRRYDRVLGDYRMSEGTPRTWLRETLRVAPIPNAAGKTFLFTAAQNDTEVHEPFWLNLQAYAKSLGAEIAVAPWTYSSSWWDETNPTSRAYAKEIAPHLCFGQMVIGDQFVFCGEMNTLQTASQPISDLTTYSRNRWAVFGHPKRQLKSVPSTDPMVQSHHVMTTGSVTRPKIIPRKAGIKSLFHAVIGAVIVEFDADANVFCRQITASDDGSFYDLDRYVSNGAVTTGHRVRAVVVADLHTRKLDNANAMATFGFDLSRSGATYRNSLLDVLKPEHILLHDVFDHETRNHHNAGDNGHAYEMHLRGRESVLSEIAQVGTFLERLKDPSRKVVVVESNHDIGLDRYIREGRYRNDPPNMRIGLKLEDMLLDQRQKVASALDANRAPPKFSLLESALRLTEADLTGVSWAYDGGSFLIDGIECGHHGFRGVNGSKGTVQGFARTGRRLSVGDKHSPEINEGVYVAGAMNLIHGYNRGPSTWSVSHILQYADGHRSIVTLQKGRWRADEKPRISLPAKLAA